MLESSININDIKEYMRTVDSEERDREERLKILRKYRAGLLDNIHMQQQCLDKIDYVIYKITKKTDN